MPLFDLSLEQLHSYKPEIGRPDDYQDFWTTSLQESRSHALKAHFEPVNYHLRTVEAFDVSFTGYAGQTIKGWLLLPKERSAKLPCIVEYIGYGGGRGFPTDWLHYASCGYAHLVMDTRGQGSNWRHGDTADIPDQGSSPHMPGFMTLGILSPESYYYRRLIIDAVRAVEAALSHEAVDPGRLAVTGGSQGGGLALAVAGLEPRIGLCLPDVPFLCHFQRAVELIDSHPYGEIQQFLKIHRHHTEQVFRTLSYMDGVNFARQAQASALFSVALMDDICPPSTVFAAYNHYAGAKQIRVYPYNKHEGGQSHHLLEKLEFLDQHFSRS